MARQVDVTDPEGRALAVPQTSAGGRVDHSAAEFEFPCGFGQLVHMLMSEGELLTCIPALQLKCS